MDSDEDDNHDEGSGNEKEELRYVDDIAEDEDDPDANDEEEDDDDEEELDEEEEEDLEMDRAKRQKLFNQESTFHAAMDQEREAEEIARLDQEIARKYGNELDDNEDGPEYGEDEEALMSSKNRLPSIKDPKLWLVKCDPGKEEFAVLSLIQKAYLHDGTREQVFIKSAFTTPASKGYVYIEADKEIHVKRAIQGVRVLKWWKIALVPITEMVDAISIKQEKAAIKMKQWVRMRGGIFRGDLAYVVALEDQGTRVTVKMIPRIDLAELQAQVKAEENGLTHKRKRSTVRPLARLFDKQQVIELGGVVSRKQGTGNDPHSHYDFYKNQKYKHGFLYRTVNARSLQVDCAPPTLDEVEQFQSRLTYDSASDDDEEAINLSSIPETKRQAVFIKDDRVIVTTGDLKHLSGRVLKVYNNMVTMMPDKAELSQALDFPINEVRKYFRVGDHVKVISGKYKEETGLIVQVNEKEDTVIVFSDISSREMRLFSQDIIESSEVSTGRDTLGDFELHDLVGLDRDVGVIVKVEVGSLKVMLPSGVVKTVKLQEIDKKRSSRFASALDTGGNQICQDDVVKVLSGPNRGRQGPIKHIFRSSVFCFSRQVSENSGIFVSQSKHCMLMGQTMSKPMTPASPSIGFGADRPNQQGRRQQRTPDFRRDPMVNQAVTITKGNWKGYKGQVVSVTEAQYRVTLAALCKTVTVPKNFVMKSEGQTQRRSTSYAGAQTPLLGSQTPDWRGGGATPAHGGDGGMTPAHHGSRTPSRESYMTPSRDVWAPMTPHRNPHTPRTPGSPGGNHDYELDFEDENVHNQPWATGSTINPHTPHTPRTPHEPRTPHTPKTPGDELDSNTDTLDDGSDDHLNPITPGNPQTPYTPTTPHTPMDDYNPKTPSTPYDEVPATPNGDGYGPDGGYSGSGGGVDGLSEGVVVKLVKGEQGGEDEDEDESETGTIVGRGADGYSVRMESGTVETVSAEKVKPAVPNKNDEVQIASGEHQGQVGTLIGIDENIDEFDGIVRINGEIIILPLSTLLKYRKPE